MIDAKDVKEFSSKLSILYAEDEEMLRESLQSTLGKLFKNVYVAKNGQEAFELFKKNDIDIILTDINMPIMSGIELIQNIEKYTDKEPVIIVLSAHNESKLLTALINIGINHFLNKPLDKQLLINSLYKTCKIVADKNLLIEYEMQLQNELMSMERKNKILEQKLKQLANQTNKNITTSSSEKKEDKVVTSQDYYSTLLQDDRDELTDLTNELENFIAMLFQSEKIDDNYLLKLSSVYNKYASILNTYPEFYKIGIHLHDFSELLLTLESKFMQDISQTGVYFESLQLTLDTFRENVWNKQAKDPRFYNASLQNDIQLVIDFLQEKEVEDNDIEFF